MPGTKSTERPISVARPTASSMAFSPAISRTLIWPPERATEIQNTTATTKNTATPSKGRRSMLRSPLLSAVSAAAAASSATSNRLVKEKHVMVGSSSLDQFHVRPGDDRFFPIPEVHFENPGS